jgi:hypothetical protein
MDYTAIGLIAAALVAGILYMQRRRARLRRDDD